MVGKFRSFLLIALLIASTSCEPAQEPLVEVTAASAPVTPTAASPSSPVCQPTLDDGVSPSYKPNAPERSVVGSGHTLTGVVLSSADCQPIANARLEFWTEEGNAGHPDSSRATFFSDPNGQYRFECNMPDHIHMRISAPGYKTIGVNSYHPNGAAEGTFDIVLQPE